MDFRTFMSEALQGAAGIAREKFGMVSGSVKEGDTNQVLTEADLLVGQYLVGLIQAQYPDYNIIDEEAGVIDNDSEFTWVVDPIDGTSNFAAGSPMYGIMMGLLHGGVSIAGGIVLPEFDELYLGVSGEGASKNGESILVSGEQHLLLSLVAYGIDGHQEAPEMTHDEVATLGEIVLGIRNLRMTNSAVDMAFTCDGRYGVYLNRTTKIWDNVAFQPIIEEAGGVVTDFWGVPVDYSNPLGRVEQNFTICAGAPELHKQVQSIITSK